LIGEKDGELSNVSPQTVSHAFNVSLGRPTDAIPQYRSHDERAWNESATREQAYEGAPYKRE